MELGHSESEKHYAQPIVKVAVLTPDLPTTGICFFGHQMVF
jgi:hypothetical protein